MSSDAPSKSRLHSSNDAKPRSPAELTSSDSNAEEPPPHTLAEDAAAGQSAILAARDDAEHASPEDDGSSITAAAAAGQDEHRQPSAEEDDRAGNAHAGQDPEKQAQQAVEELDVEHVAGQFSTLMLRLNISGLISAVLDLMPCTLRTICTIPQSKTTLVNGQEHARQELSSSSASQRSPLEWQRTSIFQLSIP